MDNNGEHPLDGWRVGVTADRRSETQSDLLIRRGAKVLHGCTMRTLDLTDSDQLAKVSKALIAEPPETLVLQTGMGTTMWLEAMDGIGVGGDLRAVLATVEVLARGPKAASAARSAASTSASRPPSPPPSRPAPPLGHEEFPIELIARKMRGRSNIMNASLEFKGIGPYCAGLLKTYLKTPLMLLVLAEGIFL